MPPKRKGRLTNNKKKNRHGGNTRPSATTFSEGVASGTVLEGTAPSLIGFERRSPLHEDYPTVYRRYKDATRRFFQYMEKQGVPEGCTMSVNTLMIIADRMHEENCTIDPLALRDLKLSIRIRSRVAKSVFGGGDSGHKHLLTVLVYCWTVLVTLPRSTTARVAIVEVEEEATRQENRFAAFQNDIEDDEDEGLDDTVFPTAPVPRPEPIPEPMSLDDLIKSDERNDAIFFLLSLDEIMGAVSEQYKMILKNHQNNRAQRIPQSALVENLIEASVATNMGIQQVHRLDMDLQLQYPHLTNPYRVLSTVVLPEVTKETALVLRHHAAIHCTEKDVIIFLGDCLECAFRNKSDPLNRTETIVSDFCAQFQVDAQGSTELQGIAKGVHTLVALEIPLASEKYQAQQMISKFQSYSSSIDSHSWLSMPHIGGKRAIHHTIRLVQIFGQMVKDTPEKNNVRARKNIFGPSPWVPGRSSKIAGDLDELLMAEILPHFVDMYRHGILGKMELPMMEEIAPFWVNIRSYIRHPDKQVTWAIAFSVHAMLTAVLETDQIANSIVSMSETVFDNFFSQVEWGQRLVERDADYFEDPRLQHNICVVLFLKNLGLRVFGQRAIWNPLCAGTTFSYLTFFGNLEAASSSLLDYHAQLRIVMYLFHGLLLNGIVRKGQIPFLEKIYDAFKSSRAVWEGPLPRRGELVQRFWTCFGLNLEDSRRMARLAQQLYDRRQGSGRDTREPSWRNRKMNEIKPEEICKCYRRVCNRDFHDVVDNYHTPEQREKNKDSEFYVLAVQTNDTLDAIEQEQHLLSLNLVSCGSVLEQFVCSLVRIMQWDPLIKSMTQGYVLNNNDDHRQGAVHLFAQHLLGALDFAADPFHHQFLQVPLGEASSQFLRVYFNNIDPAKVMWFQAVNVED